MNVENRDIDDIFKSVDTQLPEQWLTTAKWMRELQRIVAEIAPTIDKQTEHAICEGLDAFTIDKIHGVNHSFDVYRGMRWLAQQDDQLNKQEDGKYQALAVLHDLAQFLPFHNPYTGETFKGNKRKLHARIMAVATQWFGKKLHLSQKNIQEISLGIRTHDDYYQGEKHEGLPYLGQVLSDADKLFGAVFDTDPTVLAKKTMERNLEGLQGPKGWYLVRPELTQADRNQWQYGDRWNLDGISAVYKDFYNPIGFYTPAAQQLGQVRRKAFEQIMDEIYGYEYDATAQKVHDVKQSLGTTIKGRIAMRLSLVTRDPDDPQHLRKETVTTHNFFETPDGVMKKVISRAYNKEVPLKPSEAKPGFSPRGWKIRAQFHGHDSIIDPSIARFPTRDIFLQAIRHACGLA